MKRERFHRPASRTAPFPPRRRRARGGVRVRVFFQNLEQNEGFVGPSRRPPMRARVSISKVLPVVALIGVAFFAGQRFPAIAIGSEAAGGDDSAEKDGPGEEGRGPRIHSVETVAVGSEVLSKRLRMTGHLQAEHHVAVVSERAGPLAQLAVDVGELVEEGQLLASVDQRDATAKVRRFELERDRAQMALERARELARRKLVSTEEVEKADMDARIARQNLAEARLELRKGSVRAPFAGQIVARKVSPGQYITAGVELFEVADYTPLLIRLHVPQSAARNLEAGRTVRVYDRTASSARGRNSRDARAAEPLAEGRIRRLHPTVDVDTGTVEVELEVPPSAVSLRPGAFVDVEFILERRGERLAVPRAAVVDGRTGPEVFVITSRELTEEEKNAQKKPEDSTAKTEPEASKKAERVASVDRRAVELGLEDRGFFEVVQGLEPGERVVVQGHGNLDTGALIKDLSRARTEAEMAADKALGDSGAGS